MFLKALTLKGFKSFADPATLELQPGVTVVVGPNGSGKSNVVDAIGWVLGAQAPSAVRSQKMEDVIFAGTDKRTALGRAEVTLTIDNSAGIIPVEFSELTVTRTLWRSGESEYAINGVACRLLDVQELFSDTGVGRQQHVIVGQGQIDAVLNARPEERRLIIEEAAGVLKHRKRKERSERRLAATEGNLLRLGDLVREVRRQLRPLEKQADAARRHGDLVTELRALQVYVVGRELTTLKRRLGDSTAARAESRNEETLLKRRLGELDVAVMGAEARLGRLGGSDLGDALAQYEALREKARGQLNVIAERRRSIERERSAFVDQEVIASLESDAAHLRADLAGVDEEAENLGPAAEALAEAEADNARAQAAFEQEWAGGVPAPAGRTAEVRGELNALRTAAGRAGSDADRTQSRLASLRERLQRAETDGAAAGQALDAAEAAGPQLAADQEAAEQARRAADEALAEAEARRDATAAERTTWTARVDALTLALDEARSRAGAERLAGVEGVRGTLLELVDIDPGWEAAAEAACGEALDAVVVGSVDAGRRALQVLAEGDVAGAVLAVDAALGSPASGAAAPTAVPALGESVLAHVRPRSPEVGPLLTALLGSAVAVDGPWEQALDAALAHPHALVVSRSGARFGLTGWRVVTATTGATGAALDEAQARASAAVAEAEEAADAHRTARQAAEDARKAAGGARRAVEDNARALDAAASAAERASAQHEDVSGEIAALAEQQGESDERVARDRVRIEELEQLLPTLEAEDAQLAERARAMADDRRQLDEQGQRVGLLRADLLRRRTGVDDRRSFLTSRLAEVEERLAGSVEARRQAEARRVELDRREVALDRLSGFVGDCLRTVEERLARLQERRRRETEAQRALTVELEGLRRERAESEKRLEQVRERASRSELEEAEVRMRLEQAVATCRGQLDLEPEAAVSAPPPDLPDGMTPTVRVNELERELRIMGPINPLALEEYDALQERHQFLQDQLDDVKAGRRELGKVIRAIDDEIVRVFAAAYADVSENFERLFETLFPGGRGRLRLTDPDDLLTTGVEVEAKPSGKNVKKLSLLSGGERSLTALAYLFAVFRSRPSPFYVMDEVEAALDDVNLHRFLDLLAEFRREAQLIVVSHQKRTMEAADLLYGVTMQPGGSSKVVSERVSAGA